MHTLKKRSTAALIAVAIILLGTLFGVHRSVSVETAKIEKQFYNGVYLTDEKYTQPSIQAQLDKRADAALGLVTAAKNYSFASDMTEALRASREALLDAETITGKYAANMRLEKDWNQLYESLQARADNLPASVDSYVSTLRGAQGVIEKSDYNRTVASFINGALGEFPVNILKGLAFVKYPEYFGMEG